MNKNLKIVSITLVSIVVILLAMRVIFDKQYDEWSDGLQRIETWQVQYKKDHPDATSAEIDTAFTSGIQNIENWKKDYLRDHPGATDEEVKREFDAIWEKR